MRNVSIRVFCALYITPLDSIDTFIVQKVKGKE